MSKRESSAIAGFSAHQPVGVTTVALCLMTAVLWGGAAVAIRYSVDSIPAMATAAIRFTLASLFMLCWCRWDGVSPVIRNGQGLPIVISGLLLFGQIGTFHLGISQSSAAHGVLFINTYVLWVAVFEHSVTQTMRLSLRKGAGLLLAAFGVVIVVVFASGNSESARDPTTLAGDVLLLSSGFLLGIKVLYTKHALKTVEPSKLILWSGVVGVALFTVYAVAFEQIPWMRLTGPAVWTFVTGHRPAVWGLLYQGLVVAGFCFAVSTMLLRKHAASQIAVFSFTTPLFGLLLAVLLRGDELSPWLAAAAACVAMGIWLVTKAEGR